MSDHLGYVPDTVSASYNRGPECSVTFQSHAPLMRGRLAARLCAVLAGQRACCENCPADTELRGKNLMTSRVREPDPLDVITSGGKGPWSAAGGRRVGISRSLRPATRTVGRCRRPPTNLSPPADGGNRPLLWGASDLWQHQAPVFSFASHMRATEVNRPGCRQVSTPRTAV